MVAKGRLWTPDEATRALVLIQRIVSDLAADTERLRQVGCAIHHLVAEDLGSGRHVPALYRLDGDRAEIKARLDHYLEELDDLGVLPRDNLMVDFPTTLNGRPAFLCWHLSDDVPVQFWHDVDEKGSDRRPL